VQLKCPTQTAILLACLVSTAAVSAAPADLDLAGTHWDRVAKRHGLDPKVMYAVALQESRKTRGSGLASPWPWTIRSPEGGRYFASRAEAATELQRLVATYRLVSIDVGIMQVNLGWHGNTVADPTMLLDPKLNIEVGAGILREALASAPKDPELAVGHYNAYTESTARNYGRQVLRIIAALGGRL
jgi:soluble lytic murein transglycosylase-like protein